jgi:hypothetical protein
MNLTKFIAPRPVLSETEGTPSAQRKIFAYFSEPWRLCVFARVRCFRFSCVKLRQKFQKCLARFLSSKSGKTVDLNRGIEFGILPANLARRWVNPDQETVTNDLKRHVAGIPGLHKRNEKLLSPNLSASALPRNQRRPRTFGDD